MDFGDRLVWRLLVKALLKYPRNDSGDAYNSAADLAEERRGYL